MIRLLIIILLSSYSFADYNVKLGYQPKFEKFSITSNIDLRKRNGKSDYRHFELGIKIPTKFDGLSTSFNHRWTYRKNNGNWEVEKRPFFQIQQNLSSNQFSIVPALDWQLRTRQEFRMRKDNEHSTRNRLRFKTRYKEAIYDVKPFFSHELFYDFKENKTTDLRFDLGVEFTEPKIVKSSIAYRLDVDVEDETEYSSKVVFSFNF